MFLRIFLPRRQSWPSNLVRERTIVLFVSDHRTSLLVPACHDSNYMSLLSNIVHVPSTENTLPLSSPRGLSFLFPLHNVALDSVVSSSHHLINVKFLQTFSIVNNLSVHCFEQFLGRTKPRQSKAEQSPVILTCTILPGSHLNAFRLLIGLDPIERRSFGRRQSTSVY